MSPAGNEADDAGELAAISKDRRTDLGVVDEPLGPDSFAKMLPDLVDCPRCRLPKAVLKVGVRAGRERCTRDEKDRERRARSISEGTASIPEGYAWARFDGADPLPAGAALVARARVALERGLRGAVFVGHAGLGKTSLAIAMMREWMVRTGNAAHFAHAHRLGKARAQHRLGKGEAEDVSAALDAALLLIDDLTVIVVFTPPRGREGGINSRTLSEAIRARASGSGRKSSAKFPTGKSHHRVQTSARPPRDEREAA